MAKEKQGKSSQREHEHLSASYELNYWVFYIGHFSSFSLSHCTLPFIIIASLICKETEARNIRKLGPGVS